MLPYFGLVGDNHSACAVYSQEHGDVLIILDKIFLRHFKCSVDSIEY